MIMIMWAASTEDQSSRTLRRPERLHSGLPCAKRAACATESTGPEARIVAERPGHKLDVGRTRSMGASSSSVNAAR
jgi:hypothetical protein